MQNPFSLSFGKEPMSYISRGLQTEEVLDKVIAVICLFINTRIPRIFNGNALLI